MSGRVLNFAGGINVRKDNEREQRRVDDGRTGRLFSEEEKEDVTIDLILARAPLPDWGEGTATGAITEN